VRVLKIQEEFVQIGWKFGEGGGGGTEVSSQKFNIVSK
jgi:hypothetical protein